MTRRRSRAAAIAALVLAIGAGAQTSAGAAATGLASPAKKEIAMRLVSSAENSSLDWRAQYRYIEDIRDGRGYTAGIIGFCSGTGDMLEVVQAYTRARHRNPLARFIPALKRVNGSASHAGLGKRFVAAWRRAARKAAFRRAQDRERDHVYFNPAVALAKADGLQSLGQFAYYDAAVVHGFDGMRGVRERARARGHPGRGGRRDRLPRGVPRRARRRDAQGGRPRRRLADRDRATPLPARGQPRPRPAAALGGLRRPVLDHALTAGSRPRPRGERLGRHGPAELVGRSHR